MFATNVYIHTHPARYEIVSLGFTRYTTRDATQFRNAGPLTLYPAPHAQKVGAQVCHQYMFKVACLQSSRPSTRSNQLKLAVLRRINMNLSVGNGKECQKSGTERDSSPPRRADLGELFGAPDTPAQPPRQVSETIGGLPAPQCRRVVALAGRCFVRVSAAAGGTSRCSTWACRHKVFSRSRQQPGLISSPARRLPL